VYAVSEAVSNSSEHAFLDETDAVRVDDPFIQVACLRRDGADHEREVGVTISDNGQWKPPDLARGYRGYGITTMQALVDTFRIQTDDSGTTVELLCRVPAVRTLRSQPHDSS
jgi:two-component sensor histidine kinase